MGTKVPNLLTDLSFFGFEMKMVEFEASFCFMANCGQNRLGL